jgi:DNA repair protein RecN (Recombination protein N)
MLKKLYIKNYALIDEMTVEFGPGLNIITGETGAGKSIIIDALSLILGERAKTDVIRQGSKMAVVECFFNLPDAIHLNKVHNQIETGTKQLILRREVHDSGKTRCFANDSPISNATLSQIGDLLIDLHGQHAHQTLLKVDHHLEYLDNFGIDRTLLESLKSSYKSFRNLSAELEILRQKAEQLKEKKELLEFQIKEISDLNPVAGEDKILENEIKILENSERIFQAVENITSILYEEEGSAVECLSTSETLLRGLVQVDPLFNQWRHDFETSRIQIEEIVNNLKGYTNKIDFNPERLDQMRERVDMLNLLKKKYGSTLDRVLEFAENVKKDLNQLETVGDDIQRISKEVESEKKRLSEICFKVSGLRKQLAKKLETRIVAVLEELGLQKGKFQIQFSEKENPNGPVRMNDKNLDTTSHGIDRVEFLISLNPGEIVKPLATVASGGEISRIMLALKTVLAEADRVPVLVFDEIDTGISGRIARVVGNNLKEVSLKHQIICITHLPQIASIGDTHYAVEKEISENRSRTKISILNDQERVSEIAKLIGGEKITDSAIQSARELLSQEV